MTVFVKKGDAPLTEHQIEARTQEYIDTKWVPWRQQRALRNDPLAPPAPGWTLDDYNAFLRKIRADTDTNRANNTFNQQLWDYRAAVARLAQVELSVGRKAYTEQVPTGEQVWDDKLMKMVDVMQTIKHPAIDPVPATIDSVDEQGNPITVPNPGVVKDEEERAAAQAVIDATPKAVKAFK